MNIELNNQQIDLILYTLKLHKAICKLNNHKPMQTECKELIKHINSEVEVENYKIRRENVK